MLRELSVLSLEGYLSRWHQKWELWSVDISNAFFCGRATLAGSYVFGNKKKIDYELNDAPAACYKTLHGHHLRVFALSASASRHRLLTITPMGARLAPPPRTLMISFNAANLGFF